MTKFLKNADVTGYISQTSVTSSLVKTDSNGKLVAATAGTDYQAPTTALLPAGGTAGQILSKINATDYNIQWIDNFAAQLKHEVKLGATLSKGAAVYVSSANGTNMIVSAASNASEATSSKTLGLLETGGVTNDLVKVITEGLLAGLDTSTATAGDPVWLGVNGALIFGLANKPVAPAHMVFIGIVTRVQSVNGEIFVKVQNGFELDELHNVSISSLANNHTLVWESATSLWKNKTIAAALGYTPADDSAVVKLTGNQTVAGVKTFTSALLANNPSEGATGEGLIAGQSFKIDATGTGQRAIMYVVSRTLSDTYGSGLIAQYANFDGDKAFGFNLNTAGGFELYVKNTTFNKALAIANTMAATFGSSVTATSFIKSGGTSAQFLKADGSVDSTSYMPSITFVSPLVIASGGEVSIGQAGASANGYLSSTDWNTFNNKLSASTAASTYLPLTGGTLTGDLTLSGTNPRLYFTDTDNNPDYFISNTDGTFTVYDVTNSVGRFKIYSTGNAEFANGNLSIGTSASSNKLLVYGGEIGTQIVFTKDAPTGAYGRLGQDSNGTFLTQNAKWDGSSWTRDNTGGVPMALALHNGNGRYEFRIAANGANPISWTIALAIESTGAATFASSISATSAVFSGAVSVASPFTIKDTNPYIQWKNASDTRLGYIQHATNLVMAADSGSIVLNTASGSFTLASAGGATFGSSVTATNIILGTGTIGSIPSWMKVITTDSTQSGLGAVYNNKAVYLYNNGSAIKLDAYDYATSTGLDIQVGGNGGKIILANGQVKFGAYTSATSYTGTTAGYLAFDSSGNVITVAGVAATDNTKLPLAGGTMTGTPVFTAAWGNAGGDYTGITTPAYKVDVASGYWRVVYKGAHATVSGVYNFETGKNVYWGEPTDTGDYIFRGKTLKWANSAGTEYAVIHAGNIGSYTAGSASSVAWANISAGIRENYDLQFRPADNSSSYAGLSFASPGNSQNAGYLLVRGGADSDVYTQNGITIVADLGWLTLAQRTTAGKGIRFRTGVSAANRMEINESGLVTALVNLAVGSQQGFDNPGGWNKNVLIDGTHHGRFRIKASNYTYGNIDVSFWADSSVSPSHGISGSNAVFSFGGSITSLTVGGNTILHAANYSSYAVPLTGGTISGTLTVQGGGNNGATIGLNARDVTAARSATTGVIYLGSDGNHYVYYNGSDYIMPSGNLYVNGTQAVLNSGTWSISVTGTSYGLATQWLNTGSMNISSGYSQVLRNENGSGGAVTYSPLLHMAASDTMWQLQGTYGSSGNGTLYFRQGYSGNWGNWLTMLSSANYSNYALPLSGGTVSGVADFGTDSGSNTGIGIRHGSDGYGRIRFYGNGSNWATIHAFGTSSAYSPSIGYLNIDSTNGLTVGAWNDIDFKVNKGGQTYARGYRGIGNIAGTGEASYHPAGMYSVGTQWLYGDLHRNNANTHSQGHIYCNGNYGYGLVGLYSSTKYQAIFAMGDAYKIHTDGSGLNNLYGLAWSHPNAGGQAGYLNDHGLIVGVAGTTYAAISSNIWARGSISANVNVNATNGYFYGSGSIRCGDMWGGAGLYRPSGPMVFGTEANNWIFSSQAVTKVEISAGGIIVAQGKVQGEYIYSNGWTYSNGNCGWYNDTYGQGLRQVKGNYTYGNILTHGENYNGWAGYVAANGIVTAFMQNSAGTHGFYQENGAGWTAFYNYGYACWGLGTDATDPSYSLHITKYGGSNTGWIIWSDRRIKENIKTIDSALDKVLSLRGVYYNKIDDPNKERQVGYIAQEVMEVVPELVVYSEELDIYNMNYAPMVSMLTEATKEHYAKTLAQQAEIDALKEQVQTLLNHINNGV